MILHINSDTTGGAGKAALHIFDQLKLFGYADCMITKYNLDDNLADIMYPAGLFSKFLVKREYLRIQKTTQKNTFKEHFSIGNPLYYVAIKKNVEFIHLHWISDFIHFPNSFTNLGSKLRIIWTLHDMNPLTGGCHYFFGCIKYNTICKECPQLINKNKKDFVYELFNKKLDFFRTHDVYLIPTSTYTENIAKKSTLGKLARSIQKISLGISDEYIFIAKEIGKKALNINTHKVIIGLGTNNIGRDIKGLKEFITHLKTSQHKDKIHLIIFGRGNINHLELEELDYTYFGNIENNKILNLVYASMDYFGFYSVEEAFGQTILESLASGTPVAGFKTGCIEDVIKEGENGFIIQERSPKSVNDVLEKLILNKGKFNHEQISQNTHNNYSWAKIGAMYNELYKQILKD